MPSKKNNNIASIRHCSREIAHELKLLTNSNHQLADSHYHTLIELSLHGALNHHELALFLNLDKSTVSRIMQRLLKMQLITSSTDEDDHRHKRIMLTASGKKEVDNINHATNNQVKSALIQLSTTEQNTVITGMRLYAKALKRVRIKNEYHIRRLQYGDNLAVMVLIKKILKEYNADRPGFTFMDTELNNMHKAYAPKSCGYFVVIRKTDNKLVGGAGIAPHTGANKKTCELKKMYLLPEVRNLGLGYALLDKSLTFAKEHGYKQCYLETLSSMREAMMLYQKAGFKKLRKAQGNTGHYGCNVWYLKSL